MQKEQVVIEKKQSKNVSKIISIILITLMSVIAVVTITFSVVPKNFDIGLERPDYIKLHTSNQAYDQARYASDSEIYNDIMELYEKGFKTTLLDAMFKGKLTKGVTIEEGYKYFSSLSGTFVEFQYNVENVQTVKLNGKTYTPTNGINNQYISVLVEVNGNDGLNSITAYVRYGGTSTSTEYARIRFESYANQSALYSYINNL